MKPLCVRSQDCFSVHQVSVINVPSGSDTRARSWIWTLHIWVTMLEDVGFLIKMYYKALEKKKRSWELLILLALICLTSLLIMWPISTRLQLVTSSDFIFLLKPAVWTGSTKRRLRREIVADLSPPPLTQTEGDINLSLIPSSVKRPRWHQPRRGQDGPSRPGDWMRGGPGGRMDGRRRASSPQTLFLLPTPLHLNPAVDTPGQPTRWQQH